MAIHCNLYRPDFGTSPVCVLRLGRLVRQAIDVADALAIQYAQTQGCQESGTIPVTKHTPASSKVGWLCPTGRQKTCVLGMVNDIVQNKHLVYIYNFNHLTKPIYFRG